MGLDLGNHRGIFQGNLFTSKETDLNGSNRQLQTTFSENFQAQTILTTELDHQPFPSFIDLLVYF